MTAPTIELVIFDFGGVLAEEGYRQGLMAIAGANGLSPEPFFHEATEMIYDCGYLTGKADEQTYWDLLRERFGIKGSDEELRDELLDRFILRDRMFDIVIGLKERGLKLAILSDQTNWLDDLNGRAGFFRHFHKVFNSYHIARSKREADLFTDVTTELGVPPSRALFIDDNKGHIERALSKGLKAIHFTDERSFITELETYGLGPG
jgi:putative hydrolase of the HAD superfamily